MIGGTKKVRSNEESKFTKKVGIFCADIVKLNPDSQWFSENGMELKEGSKATEYLGKSADGNRTVRLDFWMKEKKSGQLLKVGYYLEDTPAVTQDGNKTYYINSQGSSSCVNTEGELKDWFVRYDYRVAKKGEKELYEFLKVWLSDLDLKEVGATLQLDTDRLFKGNFKELEQQINGEYSTPVVMAAIIKTVAKEGDIKEYQEVYNRAITYESNMKYFENKTYSEDYLEKLRDREAKKETFKGHEAFIKNLAGNYGTKHFFSLKPLHDYNPAENIVGKHEVSEDNSDY